MSFRDPIRVTLAILLLLVLAPPAAGQEEEGETAEEPETPVEGLRSRFVATFNQADVGAAAELFAEEGALLPSGLAPASGRPAVEELLRTWLETQKVVISTASQESRVEDDTGFDRGVLSFELHDEQGESLGEDVGKYAIVASRQEDGRWKIGSFIWNMDSPISTQRIARVAAGEAVTDPAPTGALQALPEAIRKAMEEEQEGDGGDY